MAADTIADAKTAPSVDSTAAAAPASATMQRSQSSIAAAALLVPGPPPSDAELATLQSIAENSLIECVELAKWQLIGQGIDVVVVSTHSDPAHAAVFATDENKLFDKAAKPPWPMGRPEIEKALSQIAEMLERFAEEPPFTIQRLAQLALSPTPYYRTLPPYLRAVTRCLLVTSPVSAFAVDTYALESAPTGEGVNGELVNGIARSSRSPSPALIPLMSPIPFLQSLDLVDDAPPNGVASSSPKHSSPAQLGDVAAVDSMPHDSPTHGRVDELDGINAHGVPTEQPRALTHAQADGQAHGLGLGIGPRPVAEDEAMAVDANGANGSAAAPSAGDSRVMGSDAMDVS